MLSTELRYLLLSDDALFAHQTAAKKGHTKAQLYLGHKYSVGGSGLKQDEKKAERWIRRSAEGGNAQAQCLLGFMYCEGKGGLPQSHAHAKDWFRLVSCIVTIHAFIPLLSGLFDASYLLHGIGTFASPYPSIRNAIIKFTSQIKAAQQGNEFSMNVLGILHSKTTNNKSET